MSLAAWFWITFALSVLFRGLRVFVSEPTKGPPIWVGDILLVVLLALLGWAVFGDMVK